MGCEYRAVKLDGAGRARRFGTELSLSFGNSWFVGAVMKELGIVFDIHAEVPSMQMLGTLPGLFYGPDFAKCRETFSGLSDEDLAAACKRALSRRKQWDSAE